MVQKFVFRDDDVVSLLREVRRHLSIALESKFSSLCLMDEKNRFSELIHTAFFDILLQKEVRQVGLYETLGASLSYTTRFCD